MCSRAVGLVLLLSGLAGCAVGPSIPRSKLSGWHAVSTPTFRIVGDVAPDELRRFAEELALFETAFARLARRPVAPTSMSTSLYVFRDADLARRFALGEPKLGVVGSAGWMLSTLEGGFATAVVRPSHLETRATLFHEHTHALLRRNRQAPLPPWYDEGLSTFFMTLGARDGAIVVGAAPAWVLRWIDEREPLSLSRLFDESVCWLKGREVGDFYAAAWALIHHQLATPAGRGELSAFTAQLERGSPWPQAFEAAFGRSPDRVESSLRAHVAMLASGAAAESLLDARELAPAAVSAPVPMPTDEAAYELGYLALQLRSEGAGVVVSALARRLLEISVAANSASARAEAALAESEALEGNEANALVRVERAVARAPDDPRVRLHQGRVELARAEALRDGSADRAATLSAAKEAYQRALSLAPGSAAAWAGLGKTWRAAGRADEAVTAFEKARALGWSEALDLELGALYLELGRRRAAFDLLWPLAQDPHGGATSERAFDLLEDAGLLRARGDAPAGTP